MNTGDSSNCITAGDGNSKPDIERKIKIFATIFLALLIAGFLVVHHRKSTYDAALAHATFKEASAPLAVDVIRVQKAPAWTSLTLPGETAAWFLSSIYARVDGYVGVWYNDIGDHVKKGQVLATIQTPDLDARLAAAKAKVKAAMALEIVRQAQADFAKTTYERWKSSPKGIVSAQERDEKKAGYNSAAARLAQAKAQIGLDQALVDNLMAFTYYKKVEAPFTGVITERNINIGDLVSAGSHHTKPLYRMAKDNPIRVFIFVPQRVADDIFDGSKAYVTVNDIPHQVFTGKVTRTANALNQQARTLRVEVDVPNHRRLLVPGLYANVKFELPSKGPVIVPPAALVYGSKGPQVCIVGTDNRVTFRNVTIARDNGNVVELGAGVSAGERVALNISGEISNGDRVDPHESRTELKDVQNILH
ncbi:MAG: efflux RND transporter periplasmic adaptor subunit [Syntrophobacteraceae bacterium]